MKNHPKVQTFLSILVLLGYIEGALILISLSPLSRKIENRPYPDLEATITVLFVVSLLVLAIFGILGMTIYMLLLIPGVLTIGYIGTEKYFSIY